MFKKITIILMMVLLASFAYAGNTETDYFHNAANQPVNNVQMLIFTCANDGGQCATVIGGAWFNQNSGSNSYISNINYPGTPSPTNYSEYFYSPNYLPLAFVVHGDYGSGHNYIYNNTFHQGENCKAQIEGFSMVNSVYANEPLVINVPVDVDSKTYSAFRDAGIPPFYVPTSASFSNVADYYSVQTKVTFKVEDNNGNLIHTESKNINLYMDTSANVQFTWTPSVNGSNFKATVYSEITDTQCNAATAEISQNTKLFDILSSRPTNQYYLLLNNLTIVNINDIIEGQNTLTFNYFKVSNEVDNSTPNRIYTELPFNADYNIYSDNNGLVGTKLLTSGVYISPRGSINPVIINGNTGISSLSAGIYWLVINGSIASHTLGYTSAGSDVIAVQFEVKGIPKHNIIFTIRDSANNAVLPNANVVIGSQSQLTNSNGIATLTNFSSGNYSFVVSLPGYSNFAGVVPVGAVDTYVSLFMTRLPSNQDCVFNGQVISHGSSVAAWQSATVPAGSTCIGQTRVCNNGVLSGSFTFDNCVVLPLSQNNCTFNGQNVPSGSSVVAWQSSTVPFGNICVGETRACTNGVLSGSYTFDNCIVLPLPNNNCTFNGQNLLNGSSVIAYQASSVVFGSSCVAESRVCNNGLLSGSFAFNSCIVLPPSDCTFNGQNVFSGANVIAYQSATVPSGSTCIGEVRSCSNGFLSGTFAFNSCSVIGNCGDGLDNDADLFTDIADPDCHFDGNASNNSSYNPSRYENLFTPGLTQCSDSLDNDGDGFIDMADSDCTSPADNTENFFTQLNYVKPDIQKENLRISSFDTGANGLFVMKAGDRDAVLHLKFENNGDYDISDVTVTASIPELSTWDKIGPLQMDVGDSVSRNLYFDLQDAEPGIYDLRLAFAGHGYENGYGRARWFEVQIE